MTSFYSFFVTISELWYCDGFTVTIGGIGWHAFKAQADVFVISSLTAITSSTSTSVNVTVGVWSDLGRKKRDSEMFFTGVNVSAPVPKQGTLAPAVRSWTVPMGRSGSLGDYELWEGSVNLGVLSTGAVTIDVIVGGKILDKAVL
jgi:hypothetical protein